MAVYDYLKTTDFLTLKDLMLSSVPADLDVSEGSFLYNACAPIALFVSSMFEMMRVILDESSLGTATGSNLDNIGSTRPRVYRREATPDYVVAVAKADPNIVIPKGTKFTTEAGTLYKMDPDVDCQPSKIVLCSENLGAQGSTIGVKLEPSPAISGVEEVVITQISATGQDRETDDEYRFRIWRSYSQPFSGSVSDYLQKIFSDFPQSRGGFNIENVVVMPRGSKSGQITISASRSPSPTHLTAGEIQALEDYFDKKVDGVGGWGASIAPIGHVVKVRDFHEFKMDWQFEIVYKRGSQFKLNDDIKDAILRASRGYLRSTINESWPSSTHFNEQIVRNATYIVRYYVNKHEFAIMSEISGLASNGNSEANKIVNIRVYKAMYWEYTDPTPYDTVPQKDLSVRSSQASASLPVMNKVTIVSAEEV